MQVQLKTKTLQTLVDKVTKGLGNNKILPITEMLGINIDAGKLALVATDGTNRLEVSITIDNTTPELHIAVPGSSFAKLVSKTTSENTLLSIEDNKLIFKGNGTYTFGLPVDEDGNLVVLPCIVIPQTPDVVVQELDTNLLKSSYVINKGSVANTLEVPAYTGFYYDNKHAITTDSLKISSVQGTFFQNSVLLPTSFVKMFSLLEGEKTTSIQTNAEIFLQSDGIILQGVKMSEITAFPITDIEPFLDAEMPQQVRINKQALLNILERLALFVTPFDENVIRLDFTKQGLVLWTLKGTSSELLPYTQAENIQEFSAKVQLLPLKNTISADPDAELTLHFGRAEALKFTAGSTTQIIALYSEQ